MPEENSDKNLLQRIHETIDQYLPSAPKIYGIIPFGTIPFFWNLTRGLMYEDGGFQEFCEHRVVDETITYTLPVVGGLWSLFQGTNDELHGEVLAKKFDDEGARVPKQRKYLRAGGSVARYGIISVTGYVAGVFARAFL